MTPRRKFLLQKWSTILGGFLSLLPNGFTWLWGNMAVYVFSYFHAKDSSDSNEVETPWLLSLHIVTWGVGLIGSSLMERKLGRKITIAIGMTLYISSVITSYFIFDSSIDLLNLTLGAVSGIGDGIIYTVVMQSVVEWADASEIGLITSGVIGAETLGSIIINQFVTHYVNPHNVKPDLVVGPTVFFSQKDIVDRVPNAFLFYGGGMAVLHIIGFCLLRKRPETNSQERTFAKETEHNVPSKQSCDEHKPILNGDLKLDAFTKQSAYNTCESSFHETEVKAGSMNCQDSQKRKFQRIGKHRLLSNARNSNGDAMSRKDDNINGSNPDCKAVSMTKHEDEYSTREMLKYKSFYAMWFANFFGDTAYVVFLNYYKMFGQVWIKDDHFLTDLANASACAGLVMTFLWGFIIDRIGVKATIMGYFCAVCLVSTFYYFTPQIDNWVYFFSTIVFYSLCTGLMTIFTVVTVKCFGKKHFSANNGIMFTAIVASNLACPPLIQLTLSYSGWFSLFFGVAATNFFSSLLIFFLVKEF